MFIRASFCFVFFLCVCEQKQTTFFYLSDLPLTMYTKILLWADSRELFHMHNKCRQRLAIVPISIGDVCQITFCIQLHKCRARRNASPWYCAGRKWEIYSDLGVIFMKSGARILHDSSAQRKLHTVWSLTIANSQAFKCKTPWILVPNNQEMQFHSRNVSANKSRAFHIGRSYATDNGGLKRLRRELPKCRNLFRTETERG